MNQTALPSHAAEPQAMGVPSGKLGMWLFLASEVMFFTGFIGSYIVLRLGSPSWPDPTQLLDTPLLAVNTFVLICSSGTMVYALQAIQNGDQKRLQMFLLFTILLGFTFLGIKAYDYNHMIHQGFTISSSLFFSCYYMLTGFHGLHVTGGVVAIITLLVRAKQGAFTPEHHTYVEYVGLYWHFVDLVWIVLFAILCLM